MKVSKAELRREKMQVFNAQVHDERNRLIALDLDARELVDCFDCGNFFTELAASGLLSERGKATSMAAVLTGLGDPRWKVRRTCADFLDHWGDQNCVQPLLQLLRDPRENVRRLALHSLLCQQCKQCPLEGDFTDAIVERALVDRSVRVRRIAIEALGGFPVDARIEHVLQAVLEKDTDPVLLSRARSALLRQRQADNAPKHLVNFRPDPPPN